MMGTLFSNVYNRFLNKITDDMYLELTPRDTIRDLQNLIITAIPGFEFPRKNLMAYKIETKEISKDEVQENDFVLREKDETVLVDYSGFEEELTEEEMNILAILMMQAWVQRQVTSIENTRMKYSGADFKMTSQANHLSKLLSLSTEVRRDSLHMQRLYKRRKEGNNGYESNWSSLREVSAIDY